MPKPTQTGNAVCRLMRATAKTVGAVADMVSSLAQGVRGAKQAAE